MNFVCDVCTFFSLVFLSAWSWERVSLADCLGAVLFAQAPWSVSSHSVLFYENTRLAESTDNTLTVSNWKENPWAVAEVPATVKSLRKEALNDSGASTCPAWPQWWLIDQAGRNCWPVRWYDWNTLNRLQLWPHRNHDLKWILTERQSWHRPSKQRWILGLSPRRLRINLAPKELTTPKPWIETWIDTWILPSCLQLDTICSRSLWLPPPLRKGASTGYHSALTQCLERKWKWSPRLGDTQSLGTHDVCFLRHPESTGKEVRLCQIQAWFKAFSSWRRWSRASSTWGEGLSLCPACLNISDQRIFWKTFLYCKISNDSEIDSDKFHWCLADVSLMSCQICRDLPSLAPDSRMNRVPQPGARQAQFSPPEPGQIVRLSAEAV